MEKPFDSPMSSPPRRNRVTVRFPGFEPRKKTRLSPTPVLNFSEVVGDPPELLVGEVADVHEDGDGGEAVGVLGGLGEVLVEVGVVPEDLDLQKYELIISWIF